jgi:hypothetical protein
LFVRWSELADKAVRAPGKSSQDATMLGDSTAKMQRRNQEMLVGTRWNASLPRLIRTVVLRLRAFALLSLRILARREDFRSSERGCPQPQHSRISNGARNNQSAPYWRTLRLGQPRSFGCGFAAL